MGADCCGGAPPGAGDAAADAIAAVAINDGASPPAGGTATVDTRSWEEIVAEKQPYYERRVELFSQIKSRHDAALEAAKAAAVPIAVVLPDGSQKPAIKGVTTPLDVAKSISSSLAKKTVVAKVDGAVWDMARPLEGDCALQLLSFDDPEGKEVRRTA